MTDPKKRRRLVPKKRHVGAAAVVAAVFSTAAFFYLLFAPLDPSLMRGAEPMVVSPDAEAGDVVAELESRGYVTNARLMRVALSVAGAFKKIEAGGYYLKRGMSQWQIFRSLANPGMKYVKVAAGMRKQEVADVVGDRLDWDAAERREFVNVHLDLGEDDLEGKYFPDTYLLPVDAEPQEVAKAMIENYDSKIEYLKKKYPNSKINYDTALRIASIIQREAAGPHDMRLISGVIWNRIFRGMSLDMDATIQYARGKKGERWWAPIKASDIREIESPYNTYKNDGLPPTPISNASLAAMEAAMSPQKTSCLFYIHDENARIHCSPTYEGHLRNIRAYLR